MKFTVQHTCTKEGGEKSVLENAPFFSEYNPKEGQKPFLGAGHYFWEYNLDYAKKWGAMRCKNSYFVCEGEISIDHQQDGYYLDLVGNRKDLVNFVELLSCFNLIHEEGTKGIDLCYIIDYLRERFPAEVFPFRVIRAVDYKNQDDIGIKIRFNDAVNSYTMLNPRMLISYRNKEDITYLKNLFIKFAS